MAKARTPVISRMLLIACGTLFALLVSELSLRAFDVDLHLLQRTLYYQCWCSPLHRTSLNAQRLFELRPRSTAYSRPAHAAEPKYNKCDISVNDLGFRGKAQPRLKKPGVYRIIVFGGSNTFGPTVGDEDTYPAQMQRIFDAEYPGKVEVWNAGVSAYVMSQTVAYAETAIKEFDPDLVILQDTNQGRRPFFYNMTFRELRKLFRQNTELFIENIPPLWKQHVPSTPRIRYLLVSTGSWIHRSLVRSSALYRTFCLSLYSCLGVFSHESPTLPITDRFSRLWEEGGQLINDRELISFTGRHKDRKVLLFFIPDTCHVFPRTIQKQNKVGIFLLRCKDKPVEYHEIHPPSYVYAWYARELCDFLVQKGYLAAASLNLKR